MDTAFQPSQLAEIVDATGGFELLPLMKDGAPGIDLQTLRPERIINLDQPGWVFFHFCNLLRLDILYYNHSMPSNLEIPNEVDLAEFISKEAHDLKSPFNRVLGFLKLVLKGMDGPIPDQAREDLTTVYQNSLYSLALMSGLVEMARVSRGERKPSVTGCQTDLLVQQVIVEWKRQLSKEFPLEVTSSAPTALVQADEFLLRQCLSNWMSYVLEFIQIEGKIEIQVEEGQHDCQFQVRSTGKKCPRPAECDLTLYGYLAQRLLALNQGYLQQLTEDEEGALVRFSLPKG
jgi:signal transduction histidine kinase